MTIIRPRLNDFHGLPFLQEEVDFAIPFLDEDIPLYVDPFLFWKINSQQDNSLHTTIVNLFNQLGSYYVNGKENESRKILIELSECSEVGLGNSKTRIGKKIGEKTADEILNLFKAIPQLYKQGFQHFEEIQLLVDKCIKLCIFGQYSNRIRQPLFFLFPTLTACNIFSSMQLSIY